MKRNSKLRTLNDEMQCLLEELSLVDSGSEEYDKILKELKEISTLSNAEYENKIQNNPIFKAAEIGVKFAGYVVVPLVMMDAGLRFEKDGNTLVSDVFSEMRRNVIFRRKND